MLAVGVLARHSGISQRGGINQAHQSKPVDAQKPSPIYARRFRGVHRFHSCLMNGELTTEPIMAGTGLDPEFVDVEGLRERFGIKRSLAYQLLNDGAIRGVSLRRRGQVRGKRLFDVASVREFLKGQPDR
jgi:hypothetical protein